MPFGKVSSLLYEPGVRATLINFVVFSQAATINSAGITRPLPGAYKCFGYTLLEF